MQPLAAEPMTFWPTIGPDAAKRVGDRIELRWPQSEPISIPLIWLRDNCPCDRCRITQTGEHRFFLGTLDELPDATSIGLVDGTLVIDWTDNHTSRFTSETFTKLARTARRSHPDARLWEPGFEPTRFPYGDIFGDAAERTRFLQELIRRGVAIVTDVPTESGECARFLERLQIPVRDTPFDRVHDVYFHSDGYNVAHTDEPLPPHTDFASYQWPPSGQLLHFLVNEVAGGDSIVVDGWAAIERLRESNPEAVEVLSRVPVAFREHSDTAESWARAPIVRLNNDGSVAGIRFSNQLMQPLDPTMPEVETFYAAYHALARILADEQHQVSYRTNAGDMQVLHSHRVLHARKGFDGTTGSRHLQDTYFEFDDIYSLAALLTGENP